MFAEENLTHCDGRDVAHEHVEEDDEQEAECCAFASCRLSVYFGERKRSTAVDDCVEVCYGVQDGDGIT